MEYEINRMDGKETVSEQGLVGVPNFPKVIINVMQDEGEMNTKLVSGWQTDT